MEQVGVLAAWVLVAATLVSALYWAIPMLSRIRFTTRVEMLRDRAVDLVLDDKLPGKDPAVRELIGVLEAFGRSARHLTVARVALYNAKFERMGVPAQGRPAPRDRLTQDQRKILRGLEQELKVALARQLIWGSPIGYISYAGYVCVQALKPSTPTRREDLALPRRDEIAKQTYVHVRQDVRAARAEALGGVRERDLVAI